MNLTRVLGHPWFPTWNKYLFCSSLSLDIPGT